MSYVRSSRSAARPSAAYIALAVSVVAMSAALLMRGRAATFPEPKLLTNDGGRVAWYHGDKHELIAFDAVVDKRTKATELFTMNPDGSGRRCVTCNADIPKGKGFVGQPEWHPDGEHIIFQVENANSKHGIFNHVSFGIDNDLWIIRRDGTGAERIYESEPLHAALHPHFNEDGTMLMFSDRSPTGKKLPRPVQRMIAPGGENPWDGWRIHLASFDINKKGTDRLSNHRTIQPNGTGFYETHEFHNGRILYSFTPGGAPYVANGFEVGIDGRGPKGITNENGTWNEHTMYSPDGKYISFISSRFDKSWRYPGSRAGELQTELYIQPVGGEPQRITNMNERKGKKVAVSDYDWDRASRRIAVQVAELGGRTDPEIYVFTVR